MANKKIAFGDNFLRFSKWYRIYTFPYHKILSNIIIFVIKFYRNCISCLMLPRCRFYPTCSAYAQEAIEKKGLWRGLVMSLRRLIRCHPFSQACFYDPVEKY